MDELRHAEHGLLVLEWLWKSRLSVRERNDLCAVLDDLRRRTVSGVVEDERLELFGLAAWLHSGLVASQ